jgi:hypothetical protein
MERVISTVSKKKSKERIRNKRNETEQTENGGAARNRLIYHSFSRLFCFIPFSLLFLNRILGALLRQADWKGSG